jgi:hypothetical protein
LGVVGLCTVAGAAHAVDIDMSVSADGEVRCEGIVTGVVPCDLTGVGFPREITVTWSLDSAQLLNGYDLNVQWDPGELTLLSSSQLLPDSEPPDTNPFLVEPDPDDPQGSMAVVLLLESFQTTALFRMTFALAGSLPADGMADISWTPNGNGLSPAGVVLDNDDGAKIDVFVPEPVPALGRVGWLLLAAALVTIGAAAPRSPRRSSCAGALSRL